MGCHVAPAAAGHGQGQAAVTEPPARKTPVPAREAHGVSRAGLVRGCELLRRGLWGKQSNKKAPRALEVLGELSKGGGDGNTTLCDWWSDSGGDSGRRV